MNTIKELIEAAIMRAAIENLIDLKHQLEEAYNDGRIGYYQYEQMKAAIEADLNTISPEIPLN
jgi:UDP-galactopyranose mutase